MIKQFEKLTAAEQERLLALPALIAVDAAIKGHEIALTDKIAAIYLAHIKMITAVFILLPYYVEVDKKFKLNFDNTVDKYSSFGAPQRIALRQEIENARKLINKVDDDFASALNHSLAMFAKRVQDADMDLIDFIIPLPIPGITAL